MASVPGIIQQGVGAGNLIASLFLPTGPWRPPQWQDGSGATLTLTVPQSGVDDQGNPFAPVIYVFDAVIRAEHQRRLVLTKNPVQTGAAITDHAYVLPASVTAEIEMSDAMLSFMRAQFSGDPSRSVSAFQTLKAVQESLVLLQVATRLNQYSNMLIEVLEAVETQDTRFAGKFTVTFQEILLAAPQSSGNQPVSAIPQVTNSSTSGTTQVTGVPATITANNSIMNAPSTADLQQAVNVPNAGSWSSENVNNLAQIFPPL